MKATSVIFFAARRADFFFDLTFDMYVKKQNKNTDGTVPHVAIVSGNQSPSVAVSTPAQNRNSRSKVSTNASDN